MKQGGSSRLIIWNDISLTTVYKQAVCNDEINATIFDVERASSRITQYF